MQATEGTGRRWPPSLLADLELCGPEWKRELWATGWGRNNRAGPKLALKEPVPLTTAHLRRTSGSFFSALIKPAICVDVCEYLLDEREWQERR